MNGLGQIKDRKLAIAMRKAFKLGCKVAVGMDGNGKVVGIGNEEDLIYYIEDNERKKVDVDATG